MSVMRILILGDNRPGHVNLSEGIAAALGRHRKIEISRLTVDRGKWPGPVAALMTRSTFSPKHVLNTVYGLQEANLPKADLLISAGGETLAANICIAKILNIPNIFYGSLRQYRASDFTLVMTSYPRQTKRAPNIVQALKPSALDPDALPAVTVNNFLSMLIGGPSGGIAFSRTDWDALEKIIEDTYRYHGIRWIVSNSRRTPREGSEMLRSLAANSDSPIAELVDVDGPVSSSLPDIFAKVTGIVCTADSSSMISEAIWARKPVIAVEPSKFTLTKNEQDYRNWLSRKGWTASLKIKALKAEKLPELFSDLKPNASNPVDNLEELLVEKLLFLKK